MQTTSRVAWESRCRRCRSCGGARLHPFHLRAQEFPARLLCLASRAISAARASAPDLRSAHAHDPIREAVGLLLEPVAWPSYLELRLDQAAHRPVADALL